MAKVKDMERAMIVYCQEHADDAGVGLEILPGVKALLTELSVCPASGLHSADCLAHCILSSASESWGPRSF